jgi:hypothetical protein
MSEIYFQNETQREIYNSIYKDYEVRRFICLEDNVVFLRKEASYIYYEIINIYLDMEELFENETTIPGEQLEEKFYYLDLELNELLDLFNFNWPVEYRLLFRRYFNVLRDPLDSINLN